jgi:hypothetical protein
MVDYVVPALLFLSAVALVTAVLGLANWFSSLNGGEAKTVYLAKLFAGVSYIALGLAGIIAHAFVDERRLLTYLLGWGFAVMGGFVFRSGWRLRKEATAEKAEK